MMTQSVGELAFYMEGLRSDCWLSETNDFENLYLLLLGLAFSVNRIGQLVCSVSGYRVMVPVTQSPTGAAL